MIADPLFWEVVGGMALACILAFELGREVERGRPSDPGEWGEADYGDFPSVSTLFHSGTHTPEA